MTDRARFARAMSRARQFQLARGQGVFGSGVVLRVELLSSSLLNLIAMGMSTLVVGWCC